MGDNKHLLLEKIDNNLKKEIITNVKKNIKNFENILYLIRCIYNEFNLRISYDYTWLYQSDYNIKELFDEEISFNKKNNNKLTCNEWCQLFKELLLFFEIKEKNITIKKEYLKHKWIEINLEDYSINKILVVDGTTNYYKRQDIYNCKINDYTSGFMFFEKNKAEYSLEQMYKNNLITDEDIMKQSLYFKQIDEKLNFKGNIIYQELKSIVIDNTNNELLLFYKIFQKLYYSRKDNNNLALNGSDISRILKKILSNTNINIEFLAYEYNYFIETCCKITLSNKIILYSEQEQLLLETKDYSDFITQKKIMKKY